MRARAALGDAQAFLTRAMLWKSDQCLVWPYGVTNRERSDSASPVIGLKEGGVSRTRSVARLVCESAYGAPKSERHVAIRTCKTNLCVNPRHLRWEVWSRHMTTGDVAERAHSTKASRYGFAADFHREESAWEAPQTNRLLVSSA